MDNKELTEKFNGTILNSLNYIFFYQNFHNCLYFSPIISYIIFLSLNVRSTVYTYFFLYHTPIPTQYRNFTKSPLGPNPSQLPKLLIFPHFFFSFIKKKKKKSDTLNITPLKVQVSEWKFILVIFKLSKVLYFGLCYLGMRLAESFPFREINSIQGVHVSSWHVHV